jgi:hypothetical protein
MQCATYCKHGTKYSAHRPVCAIWIVVPDIYNVLTAPHIQSSIFNIRSSAAIGDIFTIQWALYCKLGAKYNAHISVYAMWTVWSRTYTMYLQLHIFRMQYSAERISAVIGDISTIQCAPYCKLCAKYSAHPPVHAIWTVVPVVYNVITAPHMQDSIFNET